MKDFKDKVAVITGAASGIGFGIAEHCVKEGMKVVLSDVEEAALNQAEKSLKSEKTSVLAILTDVSRASDIETLAQKTLDAFGAVHLLFNNAGVQAEVKRGNTLWESTLADWQWVISVNLWGVIHGVRVFVPIMLQQQTECHIVNTASVAGLISGPALGIYKLTKAGIVSLSETLYCELKQRGAQIGVSVLCPSFVRSQLNEAERNRPAELRNPPEERPLTPEQQAIFKMFQEGNENAIPPEQFVEQVFKAIQQNMLYVLTHPEWNAAIQRRMEDILQGRNPTPP